MIKPEFYIPTMQEIANVNQNGFKAISTFSGTGGSCLGYRMSGYSLLWANEFIPDAQTCYKMNHKNSILDTRDIRIIQPDDILNKLKLDIGDIDLMDGSPPCFEKDTLIMTSKGLKKIQDISLNDEVLTHNNRFKKVIELFKKESETINIIKVSGIPEIKATSEHPFYVREFKRTSKTIDSKRVKMKKFDVPKWINVSDLEKNHYIGIAINNKSELPLYEGLEYKINQSDTTIIKNNLSFDNPNFWWIVGRWIGDGWVRIKHYENKSSRYDVKICCSKKDNELKEITDKLEGLYKFNISENRTTYRVEICNKELAYFLRTFGTSCYDKRIDEKILNLPVDLLKSFLDGYISADGHIENIKTGTVLYSCASASKELIVGLTACIHKVYKTHVNYHHYKRKGTHKIEDRTVNVNDIFSIRFKLTKDFRDQSFYENGCIWTPFKSKQNINWNDYVYNFGVEEDESYTVYSLIAHNCVSFSGAEGKKAQTKWGVVKKYSTGKNKQRTDDLFFQYSRLLKYLQPKVFVAENVDGLIKSDAKGYFNLIYKELTACGYKVKAKVLDAQYLGVPQRRKRLIFIGVRNDLNIDIVFPEPLDYIYNFKDAVNSLSDDRSEFLNINPNLTEMYHLTGYQDNFMKASQKIHGKDSYFSHRRMSWETPITTVTQGRATLYHPDIPRTLTINEVKRCSTFPDDFILVGNFTKKWERIGRAVPPIMMREISKIIAEKMLSKLKGY